MNMGNHYSYMHDVFPTANQRKPTMRTSDELKELVWQNGHVVMQNQANRKIPSIHEMKQSKGPELPLDDTIHEDGTAPWLQYQYPLGEDFSSELFYTMPTADHNSLNRPVTGERFSEFGSKQSCSILIDNSMMPPPICQTNSTGSDGMFNFSHLSRPSKVDIESTIGNGIQREVGGCSSTMTKVSSNRWSSQVQNKHDMSQISSNECSKQVEDAQKRFHESGQTTVTCSSGGSGSSIGRKVQQNTGNQTHKRKGRDGEESECQSEEAEYQSVDTRKQPQRSTSSRRSRSAQIHNLSERRRRDRINEKMKALQELIPHCNKTDKTSMLDEAIEYLKSLQLQVQIMWMGSGMAPMMFPNVQQYLSSLSMGMGHGSIPSSIPGGPVQIPRVPLENQSMSSANATNQGTVPLQANQMQSANVPDVYAHYLGLHQMQQPPQG